MCQGPQITTPSAATSHNARTVRRSQQNHRLVNRRLQPGLADCTYVAGSKVPKNLNSVTATKSGPSATKAKERARAFQPSEQISMLSLQQMSEAILAGPTQPSDARSLQPKIAADVEAIFPNMSSTVLESTISVEKLLLQFLKDSSGASLQSAVAKTPANECQTESEPLGGSLAFDSNPMKVQHSPSLVEAKDTTNNSRRCVQFDNDPCIVHEITPYAEIYSLHPREFVFGKDYCILPASKFADIGTALRRSMGVMDEEDSDSDEDEFDAREWEDEHFIL